jgi:hypothetical protein
MKLFRQAAMLLLLISPVLGVSAQSAFRAGKIITNNNDTISGYIDAKSESELFGECRFKPKENSRITRYTPQSIKAFAIGGNMPRKFVRAAISSVQGDVFLEVLQEGNICLYYYKGGYLNYFVQRKGETAVHSLPYQRMERYVDNGYTKQLKVIETVYHMDTLKMLMKDKPALFADIEKIQSPDRKSLMALVSNYNSNTFTVVALDIMSQTMTGKKLELLRKGKINLYMVTDAAAEQHFYIRKGEGTPLIELPYKKKDDQTYQGLLIRSYANSTTNHIDTLKKYMADAAPLYPAIADIQIPDKRKLEKLMDEYNSYINEDTYTKEHSLKRIPLNIDVVPGFSFFFVNPQDPAVRFGALVDIGFSHSNKHFFFRTGLSVFTANTPLTDNYYVSTELDQVYYPPAITFKIPLQVEYRLSEKAIQPLISIGYNLYCIDEIKPYNVVLLPVVSPGINIQAGKRFSIRLGLEFEFKNDNLVSYFPTALKRAGLFAGLQIKL